MTACRSCGRKRETHHITRSGGGNYRRPNRSYFSSICADCAVGLLENASPGQGSADRFSISGLLHFCERLPADHPLHDRAVVAAARYRAVAEARRAARS